jgi:hypothetical protein
MSILRKLIFLVLIFAVVFLFDWQSGYELSSFPIYLLPIGIAFFNFGRRGGYIAATVSAVLWTWSDLLSGHPYTHEVLRYENGAMRLLVYLIFVYGLSLYSETVAVHRRRLEETRRLIPICHGCGKVLCGDGVWRRPEEALKVGENSLPECPTCTAQEGTHH